MGIFTRFRKRTEENQEELNTGQVMTDSELLSAILGHSQIEEQDALNIPSVARSVQLIADIVSMVPIKLYQEKKTKGKIESKEITGDARTYLLNKETGDTLNAVQLKRAIVKDYLIHGSSFIYINKP